MHTIVSCARSWWQATVDGFRAGLDVLMHGTAYPRTLPTQLYRPRPNPTHIAVLEHDLLGISPEPGTAAAAILLLRRAGSCFEHQPMHSATPEPTGRCARCGAPMRMGPNGTWRTTG
ncbi:hypothetical protein [Streptomyces sp. NBC_00557]|uniref:hypothetical protein n=1 Tax=Streptomyces sp. NBC_00557 TaxID=2975776 RepID=UPI002E809C0D|nr:hypothetical protein [Streptomyces sp. NBC_00557]WUC36383.1 hypothetical protein OG956_20240 [Streptomyces sp. NBC_00557]